MIGFLTGLICGAGELFLLRRLPLAVREGKTYLVLGIVLAKLTLLACALVPIVLFVRNDIIWCGAGMCAALVLGALLLHWKNWRSGRGA